MYKSVLKPLFDRCFALLLLIFLSPVIIVLALLLSISNKGTPFFTQLRPGKNERIFRLIKFKTMTDEKDENGNLLPDEKRLHSIGKIVRKTSLDELPQFINVLKGDMSFIGPRPLLVQYLPLYNNEQKRRHEVKPGISGWAQVNGRNAISWQKKFELDIFYVDNISFLLDLKIIALTIKKIIIREGITQAGQATAEFFNGNN